MRKGIGFVAGAVLALALTGCGVVMNATYSALLAQTVAQADNDAARYDANGLSAAQVGTCLHAEANTWHAFQNATQGR
jgi:hypothetical protein